MTKNVKKIIKFLCSMIFCVVIAVGMPQVTRAAEEIAIDETNFPDANFRYYVKNFDINNNSGLSEEEIANVKNMEIFDVSSLKGIEHFTALTYLDCACNELTELDVSNNKALENLDCQSNQLTELDLSNNTALTILHCANNQLTELDLSNNTALTGLNCDNNRLIKLNIGNNTVFEELYCESNQLTKLDLSNNTALIMLYCADNQLTELDVSNIVNTLQILDCKSNQLTKLNVSNNVVLHYLGCEFNQLSSLDVSQNTDLTSLYCSSNQLTELDLSQNTNLMDLCCSSNQLTELDLSNSTSLWRLACCNNQLTELKLNSETYDKLSLYKKYLHGDISLSNLQNIIEEATNDSKTISLLKVTDITKPATYKVNGKDFTIIYVDTVIMPSESPSASPSAIPSAEPSESPSASPSAAPSATPSISSSDVHIFSDYTYTSPVTSGSAIIYGNGMNKKINGNRVNNKALTVYTDILASYKHTPNSNGTVKSTVGKVIVAVTKTNVKPEVNAKNKVTDTSASKIAKATIKNGQITVTAVGKESGLVYLWVIDTGSKGASACCPIDVKLAPKKLEVQSTTGTKLTNTKLQNGTTLDIHITGLVGSEKTEDCTYTAKVDSKNNSYVQVDAKGSTGQDFTITAKGVKNNKDTKVDITFTCNQNGKKGKFSLTITK